MTESNERSHELDRLHAQVQAMKAKVERHGEQVDKAGERIDRAQANLDELARQIEAGQRRMIEGAKNNKRRLRSQLTSAAFVTVGCSFGVLSTDRPVLQALWLLTAVGWAVVGGHVLAALSIVTKQAEIAELWGQAYDPDERVKWLTKLDETLADYPRLWPSGAPVVAALVGGTAMVVVTILTLLAR